MSTHRIFIDPDMTLHQIANNTAQAIGINTNHVLQSLMEQLHQVITVIVDQETNHTRKQQPSTDTQTRKYVHTQTHMKVHNSAEQQNNIEKKNKDNQKQTEEKVERRMDENSLIAYSEALDFVNIGKKGFILTSYNRIGQKKSKRFWMNSSMDRFFYGSDRKKPAGAYLIKDIVDVIEKEDPLSFNMGSKLQIIWRNGKYTEFDAQECRAKRQFIECFRYAQKMHCHFVENRPVGVDLSALLIGDVFWQLKQGKGLVQQHFWFSRSFDRMFYTRSLDRRQLGEASGIIFSNWMKEVETESSAFAEHRYIIRLVGHDERVKILLTDDIKVMQTWVTALKYLVDYFDQKSMLMDN